MRQAAAVVLLVIGIVLTPLAIIGLWTQVVLLDTDRFVGMTDDLLDREDVRAALGAEIAEQIVAEVPAAGVAQGALADGVTTIAGTVEFRLVFRPAMADLHGQLEAGDETLVLDLSPTLEIVRNELADINPTIADFVPTEIGDITIVTRDEQPVLWAVVRFADQLSVGAIIGVIVAFGLAVAFAENRWRMLGVSGAVVVAWALLLIIVLPLIRNGVTDQILNDTIRSGARGAWVVVTKSLQVEALIAALIGVIVAGVGFVLDFAGARKQAAAPPAPGT
ncbi:MAG: hypothetical protein ACRDWD_07880 [Acidimicrobiia bacterium]